MNDFRNLDLNLCRTFLVVAKLGSISKTATELCVSQPAVSYSIKTLEEELNCKLFNRNAKGVELTADAIKLLYYIENAYNTLETGLKTLKDSNDLLEGEIRIGVPTHICTFLVSEIIESFNKEYPGIKFSIVNKSTAEMVDLLEKRALDIIIDSYPIYSAREDVTIVDLLEVENCFIASNKYTNLLRDTKISIDELTEYPLLLQPEKTSTRQALENMIYAGAKKFQPNIEVATTEVMLDLVMKGLGIGYFTKMSVSNLLESKELIEIPVNEELPKTNICMAYVKEFLTNAPKRFIDVTKEKVYTLSYLKEKTLRMVLLQDCIYNCAFCHKEGIKKEADTLMTATDIGYLYKIFKKKYGIKTVHLTGGEPLLKDNIEAIVDELKKQNATVKLTTNGYLLKENMWIGNKIDKLNVSIHTLDEEKYEAISKKKGSYTKVISSLKDIRFRFPILKMCINVTLIKGINDDIDAIKDLIKFSASLKADLKIVEMYQKSDNKFVEIEKVEQKIKQLGYKLIKKSFRKKQYINNNHNIYIQKCTCNIVSEAKDKALCCKQNNDIFITQDGKIHLCRKSDEVIDIYNFISNKDEDKLSNIIKDIYLKMGEHCKE